MKNFAHRNARSVKEAVNLLKKHPGKAKLNAGGTDLLGLLKNSALAQYPELIINIKDIDGLEYIREDKEGLKIGALTRLCHIAGSPIVREKFAVLAEAAESVATPEIRNMGTIAGNLAQEVRCWYYRYPDQIGGTIKCLRKGGPMCNALVGDNRYHSIFGPVGLTSYACAARCPAHVAIPTYLAQIKQSRYLEAAKILLDFNPLPAITGRVCPGFCQADCKRSQLDGKVEVRCVERFLGDTMLEYRDQLYTSPESETGRTVAIVGAGPAGLSAAYYLRRAGHAVTVYDRLPEAGGMLFYGIPPYRLSKDVVRKQVDALRGMGIAFKLGTDVENGEAVEKLSRRFSAVLVASGAWKEKAQEIKGKVRALSGLEFLKNINMGDRRLPGRKVAVIGGGNTAIDVARTLLKLGAKPVVIYRRSLREMPAFADIVEKAREEGVVFRFLTLPTAAEKTGNRINLTCVKMKLGSPDASGRRRPEPQRGSEFTTVFDAIVKAIGEDPDSTILPAKLRRSVARKSSGQLLNGKIYRAGDFMDGSSSVVAAVASGREAARRIDASLADRPARRKKNKHSVQITSAAGNAARNFTVSDPTAIDPLEIMDKEEATGLTEAQAEKEASRCLDCGCLAVSPSDMAIALVALNGKIVTNQRSIDASVFFAPDAMRPTILADDEMIVEIRIPKLPFKTRQRFLKFTLRKPVDFAIVSVGTVLAAQNGICREARIVLGAVAPAPLRATAAEGKLIGKRITRQAAEAAADAAVEAAKPLSRNAYKIEVARTLVKRAVADS